jgi:nucleotide-binding universal stress UspA family protein
MVNSILIPVDGSAYSKTALQYGIYIAKKIGAGLIGLHVIDIKIIQGPLMGEIAFYSNVPASYEFIPKIEEALQSRGEKILESFRETCALSGIKPELKLIKGLIDETIILEGENADWTLLAQRGEHFHLTKGTFLGTTAEAVVRKLKKPVLITPQDFIEIESIGLAYDGSPSAHNALKLAAELSEKTKWPLTIIIVTDDHETGSKLSSKCEIFLESYEIDSDIVILNGHEDREILKFIREGSVELMIMGAFGHGRVREFFLGSTTSCIIRKSPIPVLLTH